jgi:hypothetical protein
METDMKIKTSGATGVVLDWLVAKCESVEFEIDDGALIIGTRYESDTASDDYGCEFDELYNPSTDWAQGGPIIEREGIETRLFADDGSVWYAHLGTKPFPLDAQVTGPTPLIAAMRCYVASKLGGRVEVPDELA